MNVVQKLIDLDKKSIKRIAIIGDRLTDVYVKGTMHECQDGCPKFMEESRVVCDGGAANARNQLDNWDCFTDLLSNPDGTGPIKHRHLVDGKIVFRIDQESAFEIGDVEEWQRDAIEQMKREDYSAILISDYDKGFLTPAFIRQIIDFANERKIPCVADAKREPELYAGAILKFNYEYRQKHPLEDFAMVNWSHCMIMTCGQEPPYVGSYNRPLSSGWVPVVCKNHVGAGDCFAAHLVLGLAHGLSLVEAATVAHSAGRVYVQFEHNRPPMPSEILADYCGEN